MKKYLVKFNYGNGSDKGEMLVDAGDKSEAKSSAVRIQGANGIAITTKSIYSVQEMPAPSPTSEERGQDGEPGPNYLSSHDDDPREDEDSYMELAKDMETFVDKFEESHKLTATEAIGVQPDSMKVREKWAERLRTMKDNRAIETDLLSDGEAAMFDQMIANTAEMIRDFAPIDLAKENAELKRLLHDLTPGGSEFYNDPERCAKWIRESRQEAHFSMAAIIKEEKEKNAKLEEQLNTGANQYAFAEATRQQQAKDIEGFKQIAKIAQEDLEFLLKEVQPGSYRAAFTIAELNKIIYTKKDN